MASDQFIRASRLYDVERRESFRWDWSNDQPVAESQAEVEAAVAEADVATAIDGGGER